MKLYRLKKLKNSNYGYFIFAASFQSPLEQRKHIENELAKKKYHGLVAFDFLLSSGNPNTRFQEIFFDGSMLALGSARAVSSFVNELNTVASSFYKTNIDKLDTSILTKPTKFKLRKGLTV